ncbi:AraC family transcriptional regulator [Clostridium aminobutyricum]|uniref:Helix-turn-helix transcriptional regulator n=1 Tax=Clostridium aminobutyricum TaxID=33953 RepID=A0A939D930_CLOAM|nr:AraC family transcriptional regulator [Clostridium aminobutyricum]MBN7773018.1 helix-turn-helix transcriptional regulator [Clostridium aminobutyricum]
MLKEKSYFKEELPINVTTAHIEDYPIHFHDDIEVVYVLEGSIALKNGYYNYILKQGDIFILNDREIHSFTKTNEGNMVMMLQLDLSYFSNYYGNLKNNFFVTDMQDDDESLDILRNILGRIMMEILEKGYGYEHKVIESTHNLLACLLADFQYFLMEDGKFINETKNKGNKVLAGRLRRITGYMYENYTRKLTLNEIADKEHLSIYYLSHVIKEATGLSFQDLLSFIRVEESEKLLLGTNKKVGAISEEMGFSAVRYYIKHFKTWFGMHPLEYRKKFTDKVSSRETAAKYIRCSPQEIEEAIRKQVKGVYTEYIKGKKPNPVIVELDIMAALQEESAENNFIGTLLERDNMKPIARPYNLMVSLKERLLASGINYMITTSCNGTAEINSISILVYNINDFIKNDLQHAENREKIYEIASQYDEEGEFLIKCQGLSGEFNVSRYKISQKNIVTAYQEGLRAPGVASKRETLISSWSTLPDVEFSAITTSEALSIRSTMRGISAEIILIDRQQQSNHSKAKQLLR